MNRLVQCSVQRFIARNGKLQQSFIRHQINGNQNIRFSSEVVNRRGRVESEYDPDKPVPYFSSGRYKKDGYYRQNENEDNATQLILIGSLATFLLYFCILREPNGADDKLGRDTFANFSDEALKLKEEYLHNIKNGLPVDHLYEKFDAAGIPKLFQPSRLNYNEIDRKPSQTDEEKI